MAKLLKFSAKRSPMQNGLLTLAILVMGFILAGAGPTQWWAWRFQYDPRLGSALLSHEGVGLYAPYMWVVWGWKYGDVGQLRQAVHLMTLIGFACETGMVLLVGYISYKLANYSAGMDGLHGTAHFAELDDVSETGFIDAPGHVAKGVVVGSVLLDRKGRVIHPHHPKFARRYRPVTYRLGWRQGFRKVPKRDRNGRPMFKVRKTVVREVKQLMDGGNTHLFAFCPTRSGKGVGMIIPTLLTWRHSVMMNDPKGEGWALTAGFRRAAGQVVIKFQPACIDGTGACWNPLDEIRIFTLRDVADAQMIMTMACDPKGKGLDDYFDKAGYEFLTAVALHVRYTMPDGSLASCANFLGDPNWDSDKQMYAEMMQAVHDPEGKMGWKDSLGRPTKTHPMIANAAKTMLNKEDKDRSGVLSTAKSLLSLYLDPIVARNTGRSDFLMRDLMTNDKPVSVYYVVESSDMERLTPLTRLFYSIFIRRNAVDMEFAEGQSVASYKHPMLLIGDEVASLQKLPILQEALGYVAGYGIRCFFLVQDIVQIEELYGEKQSFDSGAETRIAYAPNKIETAERLARMTGKTTVTEDSGSRSKDVIGVKPGSVSVSTNKTARDLLTADEILAIHDHDTLIFVKGRPPIYGRKAFYYENPVLVGRASMPAPKVSDRLRAQEAVAASAGEGDGATSGETERWAAARRAMREQVALRVATPGGGEGKPATAAAAAVGEGGTAARARSQYASQSRELTEEERARVAELVRDAGTVQQVVAVSAF
jgi:type IV secretion system protein VirD4